jgi:hypothetical protein
MDHFINQQKGLISNITMPLMTKNFGQCDPIIISYFIKCFDGIK